MKFDMGRAWSQATTMLSTNRDLVLVLAGVFFFLPLLALSLTLPDVMASLPKDPEAQQAALMAAFEQLLANYWWAFLLAEIVSGSGTLSLLALLRDSSRPTLGEALKLGGMAIVSYFAARILVSIALLLALTIPASIGAVTGIRAVAILGECIGIGLVMYLFVRLSLTIPTIGIERVYNPIAAMVRSWRLTKGNSLRLLAFYFLIGVCALVIYLVISMILGLVFALLGEESQAILTSLLASLLAAMMLSLMVAVLAAAHRQLAHAPGANA
jgi:hypothetical protein